MRLERDEHGFIFLDRTKSRYLDASDEEVVISHLLIPWKWPYFCQHQQRSKISHCNLRQKDSKAVYMYKCAGHLASNICLLLPNICWGCLRGIDVQDGIRTHLLVNEGAGKLVSCGRSFGIVILWRWSFPLVGPGLVEIMTTVERLTAG